MNRISKRFVAFRLVAVVILMASFVPVLAIQSSAPAAATPLPVQITAGAIHTCVLSAGGTTQCSGANDNGRLGNNSYSASAIPVNVVQGGVAYKAISAGNASTCAISFAGQAYCWGSGANGRLGNNNFGDQTAPAPVTQGGLVFTSITSGSSTTCALTAAGQAYCWGSGGNGRIGNNASVDQATPVAVTQGAVTFASITAGANHECGLTSAGQAYCWGYNGSGQLGNNTYTDQTTPVAVSQSAVTYASISAGGVNTCGLTSAGQAYCWGDGNYGRVGNGTSVTAPTPAAVTQSGITYTSVVVAIGNTCALASTGQAYCWGWGQYGTLGNGTTTSTQSTPVAVSGGYTFSSIASGDNAYSTCGVTSAQKIYCWGQRYDGRLGDNQMPTIRTAPVAVAQSSLNFISIQTSGQSTCALSAAGQAYCWGYNGSGRLGNGLTADAYLPQPVTQGGIVYASIVVTAGSGCGLTSTGQAYCWGLGSQGRLGNGAANDSATPVAVTQGGQVYVSVDAGYQYVCALTAAGQAYCWGNNSSGQLGNGTTNTSTSPVAVTQGGVTYTSIAAGQFHTCALTSGGQAYCWGSNGNGQLGNGTNTQSTTPVAVTQGGITYNSIVTGQSHTCALTSAGQTYCWGAGGGRIGVSNLSDQSTPVPVVQSGVIYKSLTVGTAHTCAVTQAGASYCWGDNSYGEIGDGTVTTRITPTAVTTGLAFSSISSGDSSYLTCALATGGQAYCWGDDRWAALGVWTGGDAVSPVSTLFIVDSEQVIASATIDPTMTFTVAGRSAACNSVANTGIATATSANLGHINSSASVVAAQDITVATNAGSGFSVNVRYAGSMSDGAGHTIADVPATGVGNAAAFPAAGTAGFGYMMSYFTSDKWIRFTTIGDTIMYNPIPSSNYSYCIAFKAQTAPTTPAGSYSATVIYTAVPIF